MSDLMIYGAIGYDVDALETVREITRAKGTDLNVRINSPGGGVWDGLAIRDAVRAHGSAKTYINGLAASMASVIFLAGSSRIMAEGSRLMIHNPWSGAVGESRDLRKEADVLDGIAEDMAKTYSDATDGKVSVDQAREMMDAETWLSPDEAIAMGFAHGVEGKRSAFVKIPVNMQYRNAPKEVSEMADEPSETGLIDRMLAKLTGTEQMKADLAKAEGALTDAVARIAAKDSEIEAMKVAHVAAIEASKIEGAQAYAADLLKNSAPDPLAHLEESTEAFATHTAKWNALRASGDYQAAGEYKKLHNTQILEGK